MATVKQIILPHHKKEDKIWNVKIRLTHKRKSTYMDTVYFVSAKQLDKKYAIKDTFLLRQVIEEVNAYRKKLNILGRQIRNRSRQTKKAA